MFKRLFSRRVKVCWILIALAGVFAALRHDYIAVWVLVAALVVAFFEGL